VNEPVAVVGWWKMTEPTRIGNGTNPNCDPDRIAKRPTCPVMVPCEPKSSCLGNNTVSIPHRTNGLLVGSPFAARVRMRTAGSMFVQCNRKYMGERCALCSPRHYRMRGACIKCPNNAWMLILFFLVAGILLGIAGYVLNKKQMVRLWRVGCHRPIDIALATSGRCMRVNSRVCLQHFAFVSIGVDYFQILAMFGNAKVAWPPAILTLFRLMSSLSFNLDITAPECSMPNLSYPTKWWVPFAVMLATARTLLEHPPCLSVQPFVFRTGCSLRAFPSASLLPWWSSTLCCGYGSMWCWASGPGAPPVGTCPPWLVHTSCSSSTCTSTSRRPP